MPFPVFSLVASLLKVSIIFHVLLSHHVDPCMKTSALSLQRKYPGMTFCASFFFYKGIILAITAMDFKGMCLSV